MEYFKFQDKDLSRLGFGAMRFPTTEPGGRIDQEETERLVEYAYKNGVNYFDTAYMYHAGHSEAALGKALSKFPRDTWYLADKMPGNFVEVVDGKLVIDLGPGTEKVVYNTPAEIFEKQLERCGVDYFDFYLIHNVAENTYDLYMDEEIGFISYAIEQKKAGRIKHLGFSTHARYETLEKFLGEYDCFEFVQVQVNYLDWSLQDGLKKYELLTKHNLPVIAMEPVRGGKLANPGEKPVEILKAARPNDSIASWAFKFLIDQPNIAVILSGMTTMEQVVENIETFGKDDPLTEKDLSAIKQAVDAMADFVPCTACQYCTTTCPMSLDIPLLINTYNELAFEKTWVVDGTLRDLADDEKPGACISCGACVPHCPQNIDIPDVLKKFDEKINELKG